MSRLTKKMLKERLDEHADALNNRKQCIEAQYDLYEKLGQRFKTDREDTAKIFAGILKQIGCELNSQNEVIKTLKNKKDAEPISTPKKTIRRKAK